MTCTFHDSKLAATTVIQGTLGGDGTFSSTTAGVSWHSIFSIVTSSGAGTDTSFNVDPDNAYGIAETPIPAGWKFESAGCTGQASGTVGSFTVAPGSTVTCTFHDSKLSTIIVVKDTLGGDGAFSFTTAAGSWPSSFTISTTGGSGTVTFVTVDPDNTYGIAEIVPAGWTLSSVSCTSGTPANFTVVPGTTVTCTLNDSKLT